MRSCEEPRWGWGHWDPSPILFLSLLSAAPFGLLGEETRQVRGLKAVEVSGNATLEARLESRAAGGGRGQAGSRDVWPREWLHREEFFILGLGMKASCLLGSLDPDSALSDPGAAILVFFFSYLCSDLLTWVQAVLALPLLHPPLPLHRDCLSPHMNFSCLGPTLCVPSISQVPCLSPQASPLPCVSP